MVFVNPIVCPVQAVSCIVMSHCPFKQVLSWQVLSLSCSSRYCHVPLSVQASVVLFKQILSCPIVHSSKYCHVQASIVVVLFKQILSCPIIRSSKYSIVLSQMLSYSSRYCRPVQADIVGLSFPRRDPFRASPQDFKTHFVRKFSTPYKYARDCTYYRLEFVFFELQFRFSLSTKSSLSYPKKKKKKEFFCRLEGDMFFLLLRPYRKQYYSARTTGSKSIATLISRAQNINKKYDNLHFLTFDF